MRLVALAVFAVSLFAAPAAAQYNRAAGQNAPTTQVVEEVRDQATGEVRRQVVEREAPRDSYGNADGSRFDLAVDGAFDFALPKQALKEKGFSVYRWVGKAPSPEELEKALQKSNQLWLISGSERQLNDAHAKIIRRFFDAGHGVYIWGDNEPYYADANFIAEKLFGTKMLGNLMGDQTVGLHKEVEGKKTGLRRKHLLSTGLEYIYEGITIATLQPNDALEPLIYGSAGNLVAAFYDRGGKRAILDGGFTRLYVKWDTAGTGRYVKNAAAWLANAERFGTAVLGPTAKADSVAAK